MEILKNHMRNIYLYLIFFFFLRIIKLFFYFKKSFFNLFFNFRLQFSLHIVHFQILTFKMFQRMWMLLIDDLRAIWHLNIVIWYIGKSAALVYSIVREFIYLIISINRPIKLILVYVLRWKKVCVVWILHHWLESIIFVHISRNELRII